MRRSSLKLSPQPAGIRRHTPNLPAYESFLKARHYLQQWTPESLTSSRDYLQRAIALDPGFAQAYCELAGAYFSLVTENQLLPRDAAGLMREAAQRALEIDPSLPDPQMVLGMVAVLDYNWDEAGRQFNLVLGRGSISLPARYFYAGFYLLPLGRIQEASDQIELALRDDPLNLLLLGSQGLFSLGAGRYLEGEAALQQVLDLDTRFWIAYLWIGGHRVAQGLLEDALEFTEKGYALAPGNFFIVGQLAGILKRMGHHERAGALMSQVGDATAFGAPAGFVAYHVVLGELDLAADWFEKLIEQRDTRVPWVVPHMFDAALTSSPRWPKLARMMNLPA